MLGGGIIPDEDIEELKKAGVEDVFTPGAALSDIIEAFNRACNEFYSKQ